MADPPPIPRCSARGRAAVASKSGPSSLAAGLLIALAMAGCESGGQGGATQADDIQPALTLSLPRVEDAPYPRVVDVPDRPQGLPTEQQLAERRRRLEADRDEALGRDPAAAAPSPAPEPLPELTETMQDIAVARPSTGPDEAARAGISVQVATVYFPSDSANLDEQIIEVLSQVAREQQSIGAGIRVIGQPGTISSEEIARRQLVVLRQTLVRMGVPPTRIDTELAEPGGGAESDHGRAVIYLDY